MLRAVLRLTGVALFIVAVPVGAQEAAEEAKIRSFLESYDTAFNAKDLEKLATFYHPDVTIFEGGGVNRGWPDYRDHHLGPELKDFENLKFAHTSVTPRLLDSGGRAAYVTAEYSLKARVKDRDVDATGLATLILIKEGDAWQIRHSHTSSRRRPPPPSGEAR